MAYTEDNNLHLSIRVNRLKVINSRFIMSKDSSDKFCGMRVLENCIVIMKKNRIV